MNYREFRTIRAHLGLALLALVAAGCAGSPEPVAAPAPQSGSTEKVASPRPEVRSSSRRSTGDKAATIALDQLGTPYRYGGSTPSGFDCSGLVQYSYSRAGLSVPRTTQALWNESKTVAWKDRQVGDLLFFEFEGKMSHVGMYIGNRQFVHAPSSGKHVSVASLQSDYYRDALLRVGRPRQ